MKPRQSSTYLDKPIMLDEFYDFQRLIYREVGIKLSEHKLDLVLSRLVKRLKYLKISSFRDYYEFLISSQGKSSGELQIFIDLLTTHETSFFREQKTFIYLAEEVVSCWDRSEELVIWSSACATGEEVFSIAIMLAECLELYALWNVWGSDVSDRVLLAAEQAIYPGSSILKISEQLKRRYLLKGFGSKSGMFAITPALRRKVNIFKFNLINSKLPQRRFNIIFCRNVLMYFDDKTRTSVVTRLCDTLVKGGYFISSFSEAVNLMTDELTVIQPGIYQKKAHIKSV